ncbi:MAG: hypothetical protein EOP56_06320 [Sphingobacteriales bacterium]|nr:MAG: hypothetical protein EOP56_06320 [Sphingobacteriales bacterium]
MALLTRINIPALFLLSILASLFLESRLTALAALLALLVLLFYLAWLPSNSTKYIGLMLPVAFVFSMMMALLDSDVHGIAALFTWGNMAACLMYTFGAFLVLAPMRLLKVESPARYSLIMLFTVASAFIMGRSASSFAQTMFMSVLCFLYLTLVNGTIDLIKLIRASR